MNMFSKRLVIIASFCLSAALCHADTVATQPMPSVVTAVTAEKPSEVLKPQATAPVATASQGYRAKVLEKLRGLWGACKDKSAKAVGYAASAQASARAKAMDKLRELWMAYKATSAKELGYAALGYAGTAIRYGYKGFKFAVGIPYEINALLYSLVLPKPIVALLLYPLFTGLCPSLSLFSEAFKLLGFSAESIFLLYQGLSVAYWNIGYAEAFYELITSLWRDHSYSEWAKVPGRVIGSIVCAAFILFFGVCAIRCVEDVWRLRDIFYVQLADMFGFYDAAAPVTDACEKVAGGMDGALKFFKSSLDTIKNRNININTVNDQGAIKKAYKFLSLKFHPDKGGSPEDFMKLQNAFECLKVA